MNKLQFQKAIEQEFKRLNHLFIEYQDHHIKDLEYDVSVESMLKTIIFTLDNLGYRLRG